MKKFIMALAATIAMFATSTMAQKVPDSKSGFASSEACLTAVRAGSALAYVPVTNRAPGSGYAQMSMADAGYANGACVQGLTTFTASTWVYLPANFQIGKRDETIVMWQCGNAIKSIAKVPMDQTITRMASAISFATAPQVCTASQEKCEMIKWCDQNQGWETRVVGGVTEQFCAVPSLGRRVERITTTTVEDKHVIVPVQTVEVRPVQAAAPVNVDFPNVQVNVRGGGVNVSGTKCNFDCISREVAKDVAGHQNIPSVNKQCEIRWKNDNTGEQGRLLVDNYSGKIRLASVRGNQSIPAKVMVTPGNAHSTDCNVDQAEVKKNWGGIDANGKPFGVVYMMGLPPTCKPL